MRKTSVCVLCGLMGLATAAMAAAQTGSTGAMGTESGSTGNNGSSSGGMSTNDESTASHHKWPGGTKKSTKKHSAAKSHTVIGEVTAVDATAKTVTVKAKSGDVNLSWDDKTVVTPKGQDIKQGDTVTASYKMSGETKMASRVRVHAPKAAPAAAKPPSK